MRLASRIVVVMIASLIPIVGVEIYNTIQLYKSRDAEVRVTALRQAELAASEINRMIEGMRGTMVAVANAPAARSLNSELCSPFLTQLTQQIKYLQVLLVADSTGQVRCASLPTYLKINISDRAYFQQAMAQPDLVVGDVVTSRATQKPVLPLAFPVLDDAGKHVGTVVSSIDAQWMSEQLLQRGFPTGGSITIVDKNGTIFARQPDSEKFIGTKFPEQYKYLLSETESGVVDGIAQDGTRRLMGYIPLSKPPYGLFISSGVSVKETFFTLTSATWRQFAMTAMAVIASLLLAYFMSRRFVTRRLDGLLSTISRWQDNDLSARTGLTPDQGEPGILGYQFDRTIEKIAKREEAINVLLRELVHRSKNQITVLVSLCNRLAHGQNTVQGYRDSIIERLMAMATSQDLLLQNDGKAVDLETLIRAQMKSFEDGNPARISITGPVVSLEADAARSLGMAIHELSTNATKYGALSNRKGHVSIAWENTTGREKFIEFSWMETGGPKVTVPETRGFGRTLVEKIVPMQLNGSAQLHYLPEGVLWSIMFEAVMTVSPPIPTISHGAMTTVSSNATTTIASNFWRYA